MKLVKQLAAEPQDDGSAGSEPHETLLDMRIKGQDQHYEICIGDTALARLVPLLEGRRCVIVTDDTVWALHGKALCEALQLEPGANEQISNWGQALNQTLCLSPNSNQCLSPNSNQCQSSDISETKTRLLAIAVIPHGESSKNMTQLTRLYQDFVRAGLTRRDLVIAFGGGVVGDLAGYAAASWLRGVAFIQIPTSLLAMVDSSIGGKVAIDLPEGKNLVGAFHQPKAVLINPRFLDTLPVRQLRDGIAEMVKAAMIRDAALLPVILELFSARVSANASNGSISSLPEINALLKSALNIKKHFVETDEKEIGDRKLLNFGHTLGHAAESKDGYSAEIMTHGEGVALGMQWITRLSEAKGLSQPGTTKHLEDALFQLGFEVAPPLDFPALKDWVLRDKKNTETGLEVILIRVPGEGCVYTIASDKIDAFFNSVT